MSKNKKNKGTFKKVLAYIGKYRIYLFISIILATLTVALTLLLPVLIGNAIDLIIGKDQVDLKAIAKIFGVCAVMIVLTALFQWIMNV